MRSALAYLLYHSWLNRLRTRIRRLRQPKYLFGLLVGGVYFAYLFGFQYMFSGRRGPGPGGFVPTPENVAIFESIGALGLLAIVLLAWLIPHERAALIFSEAEINFLFPAPIDRRTLIHFKLLRSQIGILFTTVLFTFIFRRSVSGSSVWIRCIGWWVIFSTLNLHFLGASFIRTILMERGVSAWKRRIAVLLLVVIGAAAVVLWAVKTIPAPDVGQFHGLNDIKYYFSQAVQAGPLPWLLYPFRLVVRPYLSTSPLGFAEAMVPSAAILLVHYWWVIRSNVAFEEASVEASQKLAERIATMRANRGSFGAKPKKKKRPPFALRPVGLPAIGLLWKNLIGAGQAFTLRFWLFTLWIAIVGVVASTATARTFNFPVLLAVLSLVFLAMSFFLGPQLIRQDFRQDLPMADVLKSYPIKGWEVALGELLAPAIILTGVQWLLLLLAAGLTSRLGDKVDVDWGLRLSLASGLAVIAPFVNLVTLIIPNAAVLLLPGWFQAGKDSPQGIEATGQRLIFALGQMVVFALALVPVAFVFMLVYFPSSFVVGGYFAVPIAAVAAALILAVEIGLGILWLGRLFDRFDLSSEPTS
jgi:ABC-2 type transport system permease protein